MGYNSARYIHTLYQAMNLAFADRDFYYGDPDLPPAEPRLGLLSKEYAAARAKADRLGRGTIRTRSPATRTRSRARRIPTSTCSRSGRARRRRKAERSRRAARAAFEEGFFAGTTSIEAADDEGWVVSVTPSGGWNPACIAGKTGIGMSQRMQSFVLDPAENPFNVLEPGKRPRVTLTPSLALKDGKPFLAFAVQGGDGQDQNLLQFFLNVVEFGMNVQEAVEAPNITSYQMRSSFGEHESRAGEARAPRVRAGLGAGRAREDGLQDRDRDEDLRADQRDLLRPRATARCGAARATTATTTASPGRRALRASASPGSPAASPRGRTPRALPRSRNRKNSPESGPFVSRAKSSVLPDGENTAPISMWPVLTSGGSFVFGVHALSRRRDS